ncbi:MAG: SCO family protein [Cytophagaceae bacterium]|nr:SCO family protein [Cytophagaceae bacterium]
MKITKKTVFLSIIFMIPVFLLIAFGIFGKSRHRLPVFFALDSIQTSAGYQVTAAETIPNFQLTDQDNQPFTWSSHQQKIKVVDFVFTRCGGICPKMTRHLTRVQEYFREDSSVVLVSLTVDPGYDTVSILKQYADQYQAQKKKWYFLTGSKDSIYKLGQQHFYLTTKQNELDPTDFLHSEKIVLVDQNGWIRGYYNGTSEEEIDRLITEIKVLQKISISN